MARSDTSLWNVLFPMASNGNQQHLVARWHGGAPGCRPDSLLCGWHRWADGCRGFPDVCFIAIPVRCPPLPVQWV